MILSTLLASKGVLSFSRAGLTAQEIKLETVDLGATARRVLELEAARGGQVELQVPDSLSVLAQPELLSRALANLVQALQRLGRTEAAASAAARLSQLEPTPPFHWFNAGLQAMREHDYRKARELFARELDREPDYHEFHFWLAQAEARLGNLAQARRHLELAAAADA